MYYFFYESSIEWQKILGADIIDEKREHLY